MKFKIESKPSPLRQLDNIRQLRNVLKQIKADTGGKFVDALLAHPLSLNKAIGKDFSLSDHNYIDLRCDVYFNIPLVSSASIGKGSNYCLTECRNNEEGMMISDKKELTAYLQNLESIPSVILPTKLELSQKIENAKSKFIYELTS